MREGHVKKLEIYWDDSVRFVAGWAYRWDGGSGAIGDSDCGFAPDADPAALVRELIELGEIPRESVAVAVLDNEGHEKLRAEILSTAELGAWLAGESIGNSSVREVADRVDHEGALQIIGEWVAEAARAGDLGLTLALEARLDHDSVARAFEETVREGMEKALAAAGEAR
jgi:hypothetical protein